jgi:hypothetical protein
MTFEELWEQYMLEEPSDAVEYMHWSPREEDSSLQLIAAVDADGVAFVACWGYARGLISVERKRQLWAEARGLLSKE